MLDTVAVVQSSPERSKRKSGPRAGFNRPSSLTQAMDLQAIAMAAAKDPEVPSHVKAAHMRAWVDLEEIRLKLKGIGAPKPVEARNSKPKTRARSNGPVGDAKPPAPAPDPGKGTVT